MSATASQRKREFLEATVRVVDCIVCQKTGCQTADGWYTEAVTEHDEDGAYLAGSGESLDDAADIPAGWVCSKACRSQAMYQQADKSDKEALRKVLDACRVLSEYGKDAIRTIQEGMDDSFVRIVSEANGFLEAVAADDDPAWTNRRTREEELETVAHRARVNLEWSADRMSLTAAAAVSNPSIFRESEVYSSARNAATCARIALDLKAAEEGSDETL